AERTGGVAMGDFILLHDVSSFLGIDEDKLQQAVPGMEEGGVPEEIKRDLIQEGFTKSDSALGNCLTGLDTLPARYTQALELFFKKQAIPALASSDLITPDTTLGEYIGQLDR